MLLMAPWAKVRVIALPAPKCSPYTVTEPVTATMWSGEKEMAAAGAGGGEVGAVEGCVVGWEVGCEAGCEVGCACVALVAGGVDPPAGAAPVLGVEVWAGGAVGVAPGRT